MTRTIAIGDVHGCSLALATIIDAIRPARQDVVVTLGDYIHRGPDSRGVIDHLIELRNRCQLIPLLGNHEQMLIMDAGESVGFERAVLDVEPEYPAAGSGFDLFSRDQWGFVKSCRDYFETASHIFTHANYLPHVPMDRQSDRFLRWEPLQPQWVKPHCSGKTVIVGHTEQKDGEVLDLGFLKCIDTYCYGGRWLTALEVNTGQLWQASNNGNLRLELDSSSS